ncbi:RNB domain [Fragilaria crotonensis]|nr:RNB domain [Fragilaria crotonensis]
MKLTLWCLLALGILDLSSSFSFVTHLNPHSCRHHDNDRHHDESRRPQCTSTTTTSQLSSHNHGRRGYPVTPLFAKTLSAKARMSERWYTGVLEEPSLSSSSSTSSQQQRQQQQEQIEEECLVVASTIISNRLLQLRNDKGDKEMNDETTAVSSTTPITTTRAHDLAKGRFQDLTMTKEGSQILESLFLDESLVHVTDNVILYGTIYLVQSLCIMGMLVGVKGSPEQEQRRVQHLREIDNDHGAAVATNDADNGTDDGTNNKNRKSLQDMSIGNLKYLSDQTAGTQLLAKLSLKRTTQGAMDLLISLGAWTKHEDLSLLRSGFPISFTDQQLQVAESAAQDTVDVDELLGIRRD